MPVPPVERAGVVVVEGDDGFGGRDIGDERPDDSRPERPEDRPDLVLAGGDADRHGKPAEAARIECDDPLAQGRADEPPIDVERGDEDLADGLGRVQVVLRGVAERRDAPGRPADPEQRDIDPLPEVEDRADARVRNERPLRGGVIDETGRHQPARLATECVGDAPVRLAFRAGRPVAAAQRHDRDRDGRGGLLEGRGGRRHRGPVADTDDRARPERAAQDLGGQPADHPASEVLGTGDGRGEMDGVEAEGPAQGVAGRALDGRAVDDPDLDDPLGPCALEQARHLWPRDAELLGDRVLRLAELVVEAARPDELLQVAHRAPCTFVLDRCAFTVRRSSGLGGTVSSEPFRGRRTTSRRSRLCDFVLRIVGIQRSRSPEATARPQAAAAPPRIREELSFPGKRSVDRGARR